MFIIFLIGFIIISGCNSHKENKYSKLKIKLDSTFSENLNDSISLWCKNSKPYIYYTHDALTNFRTFKWYSLLSDRYEFNIKNKFFIEQNFEFDLNSDTIFYIKKTLNYQHHTIFNKNELLNSDTIEFTYTSNGCLHHYYEKSLLIKDKTTNDYTLKTMSNYLYNSKEPLNIVKKVKATIIEDLLNVELTSSAQQIKAKNSYLQISSTTTNSFYILIKDQLFQFDDQGIDDWNSYEKFKKKYIN